VLFVGQFVFLDSREEQLASSLGEEHPYEDARWTGRFDSRQTKALYNDTEPQSSCQGVVELTTAILVRWVRPAPTPAQSKERL
jgi:hypothetical protein